MHKTSLRSVIQATDSTCSGWTAKIAATKRSARAARHPREDDKHQEHVGRVQEHVRDVVAVGPVLIHRGVEHQRQPRQRDPVGVVELRERPLEAGQFQPVEHVTVPFHVRRIVEDDEIEAADLDVDAEGQRQKQCPQHQVRPQERLARRGRLLTGNRRRGRISGRAGRCIKRRGRGGLKRCARR